MKSLLSRRPSSASSSKAMDVQGSRSASLPRGQEGDFYYPTTAAATHTSSALPFKRASSQPTARTNATTNISSPSSIGSAPPNKSPPSSWMKNRNRFSVNQQPRGSTKDAMDGKSDMISIANGKATTTSARPNGPARAATAPSTVRSMASSYDERVRERFERTEKRQIVPNHLNEERTTHPSIFRVTNADNAAPIDEVQPLVQPDKSPPLRELSSKPVVDEPQTTSANGDGSYLDGTRSLRSESGLIAKASNVPPRRTRTASAVEPQLAEMSRREIPFGSTTSGGGDVEDGNSVNNRMTLSRRLSGITKRASANVLNLSVRTNTHSTVERSKSARVKEGSAPPLQRMAGPSRAPVTPLTPAELACHLKDLAISHADGLLSDEEYRLLRQGLFTRTQLEEDSNPTSTTPRASSFWQGATSALDAEPMSISLKHSPSSPIIRKGIIDVLEEQETLFSQPPSGTDSPSTEKGRNKASSIGRNSLRLTLAAGGVPLFKRPASRSCRENRVGCDQWSESRSSANGAGQRSDSIRHQPFKLAGSAASAGSSAEPNRKASDATTVGSISASRFGSVKGSDRATQSGSNSPVSLSQSSIKRRLRGAGASSKEGEAERKCEAERQVEEARSVRRQKVDTSRMGRERTASSLSVPKRNRLQSSGSARALSLPRGTEGSSDPSALPPIPIDSTAFLLATAAALDTNDVEYSDKSSDIIEAEIRIVKAEGQRVAFAFQSLEDGLMEKGKKILLQEEKEGGGFIDKEDLEKKLQWLREGGSEWDAGRPHPPARRDTKGEAPVQRQPSALRRLSNNFFPNSSSSTHRVTRELSTSSQPSREPQPHHLTSSSSSPPPLPPKMQQPPTSNPLPISSNLKSLRKEMLEIQTRRNDVAKRYEDRLAFLASKNRAAKAREKFV